MHETSKICILQPIHVLSSNLIKLFILFKKKNISINKLCKLKTKFTYLHVQLYIDSNCMHVLHNIRVNGDQFMHIWNDLNKAYIFNMYVLAMIIAYKKIKNKKTWKNVIYDWKERECSLHTLEYVNGSLQICIFSFKKNVMNTLETEW